MLSEASSAPATQSHPSAVAAVPLSAAALAQLEREAGFVVIKDGLGGYTHNAAIHVVLGTC